MGPGPGVGSLLNQRRPSYPGAHPGLSPGGLHTLVISLDAASEKVHDRHRGDSLSGVSGSETQGALLRKIYFKNPFGYHESVLKVILAQVRNDHTLSFIGGVDHLALSHIDAGMPDGMSPMAKKEKVSR
jgi:hypothetical protein